MNKYETFECLHCDGTGCEECNNGWVDHKAHLVQEMYLQENMDASQEGEGLEYGGPDAGCSEWTPPVKKKTWHQLKREYVNIMDDDAKIAQDWKLRRIDWDKCKKQIAENQKKRGVIIDQMDKLNKEK